MTETWTRLHRVADTIGVPVHYTDRSVWDEFDDRGIPRDTMPSDMSGFDGNTIWIEAESPPRELTHELAHFICAGDLGSRKLPNYGLEAIQWLSKAVKSLKGISERDADNLKYFLWSVSDHVEMYEVVYVDLALLEWATDRTEAKAWADELQVMSGQQGQEIVCPYTFQDTYSAAEAWTLVLQRGFDLLKFHSPRVAQMVELKGVEP